MACNAYSEDLRTIVMNKVQEGKLTLKEISTFFKINVKTLYDWRMQFKETNSLAPKTGFQKGHSHKITDLEEFKRFVESNADLTLKEMANKLGNISPSTVNRGLKKIGFSSKKKHLIT